MSVRGLCKEYGNRSAVDGVDFDIEWGTCVAMLGPNGAGKSTTVEILEGLRRRSGGEVTVCDADPGTAGRAWRTRIGIVPQSSALGEEQTVRELVTQFAAYYPRPRSPTEVIELVGLSDQANQRSKRLSGGQQRRLDVALGLIGRPELLFLDEPTTGFDPEARRSFWDLIANLRNEGTTILLTTHYLEEAAVLAERVVVLARGRVVADGTPDQLTGSEGLVTVTWTQDGQHQERSTSTPTELITTLAGHFAGEIPDLAVRRRSLEDAYLELIGAEA